LAGLSPLIDWLGRHVHVLFTPANVGELPQFYLFWILAYCGINILWDIRTTKTPAFHVTRLNGKVSVLHNAATFTSSFMIIVGMFDPNVGKLAGETMIPLLLAGLSGIIVTIGEICPYKPSREID
jgi:hypothetical protein